MSDIHENTIFHFEILLFLIKITYFIIMVFGLWRNINYLRLLKRNSYIETNWLSRTCLIGVLCLDSEYEFLE